MARRQPIRKSGTASPATAGITKRITGNGNMGKGSRKKNKSGVRVKDPTPAEIAAETQKMRDENLEKMRKK